MKGNPVYDKALAYAVRVVNLYKFLNEEKQEPLNKTKNKFSSFIVDVRTVCNS